METFLTSGLMLTVATGFIDLLAWVSKKFGIAPKHGLVAGAIVVAVVYQAFITFTPPEVKEHIITFSIAAMGLAVLLHEYLLKSFRE